MSHPSKAPAATAVHPGAASATLPRPAGTRRSVSPEASYRQPFHEEKAALPASTEMDATCAECENALAGTSSAEVGMRAAPCLPPGMSKRLVKSASKSMPS